jgi:GH15 family glucan-1,4-alpha-glucosidase
MASRIEDYALIGDCQTAALVGRDGSIDWLCLPRFDSGACFAALVGTEDNGRWRIRPAVPHRTVRRSYRGDTLILETDFEADHGAVTVIDFMPLRRGAPDLVRVVQGRRGQVPMEMDLTIRFDYGSIVPWVRAVERGIRATAGPDSVHCRADVELRGKGLSTVAEFTISEGQTVSFTLTWTETHQDHPPERDWRESLAHTEDWWKKWTSRCRYKGKWQDAVIRSLITLKALTYAPTGGIVAAPTTGLPESIGGVRNWDYRYCWVRDATFVLYALILGGYHEEAKAWREWLVRAVAGTPSEIQIMYGIAGERRLTELELGWLSGYEGSKPVRIGNAAHRQFQLDVYGEVVDAMSTARRAGLHPSGDAWRVESALMDFLESAWKQPDEGIWEVRGPRRHFTHSKVMAWVAADRHAAAVEEFGLRGDASKWKSLREEIRRQILQCGFDESLNSFVQYYGSKDVDASLLMLPALGFMDARDPKMLGTVRRIEDTLMRDGFIARYPNRKSLDGLPEGEGAFLLCTFWYADNLVLQGEFGKAEEAFERLLGLRNDVGLLAEEFDPGQRRFLGNFPQAFSHVGLINTAQNLSDHGPARHRSARRGHVPGAEPAGRLRS